MTIIGNIIMPQKVRFFFGGNEPDKGLWFDTAQGGTDQNVGVLKYKDASGNLSVVYPVTKMEAVEGLTTELTGMKNGYLPKSGGAMTGPIAMGGSKVTGLGEPADSADAVTKGYVDARKLTASVTLAADGWEQERQTVGVVGVTAGNTVIVAPAPDSFTAYSEAGVRCTGQGAGTLTFACVDVPADALTVNVVILA